MRYKLYATTEEYEDKLIYEDNDFIKVARKMLLCDEYSEYVLSYHSEFVNEFEYAFYPKTQTVVNIGYTSAIPMHVDEFIAYLENIQV